MVTNIDENVGRLRRKLQELEIEDNTILVFMSDNGQTGVGEHVPDQYNAGMRGIKGSPYEGGHRVPFFIRWPGGGFSTGRTVRELAGYVDFIPTILDLCGAAVPEDRTFHGESLVPLLRGEGGPHWTARTLVTDTQRVAHPMKWRRSCVMRDRWRLVNREELYDIQSDPGQTQNVADTHPAEVAELRAAYEDWWALCSRQMDADIPISIGAEVQATAVLRSHDLRNEQDHAVVWNQGQVRRGEVCQGWWEIFVEEDGEYAFSLRRWPEESGHAVRAGIDGDDVTFRRDGIAPGAESMYTGGVELPFDTAVLDISGKPQQCVEIGPDDPAATFLVSLRRGARHVRARFSAPSGAYCSAYYVYVRRVR
jgi:hypothetical protein